MSKQVSRILNYVAFYSLLGFQLILFAAMLFENRSNTTVLIFYISLLLLMIPGNWYIATKSNFTGIIKPLVSRVNLINVIAFTLGAVLTYLIAHQLPFTPPLQVVIAGSAVGLAGCVFQLMRFTKLKHLPIVIYTGVFVGMSQPIRLGEGLLLVGLAGLIGAIYFLICPNVGNGVGGKLGTISFAGVLIVTLIFGDISVSAAPPAGGAILLIAMTLSAIAAAGTYYLAHFVGVVASSTLISLVVAIGFRFITWSVGEFDLAAMIPVIVIGASFAGMSAKLMIHDVIYVVLAGVLFGVIYTTSFATSNHFFSGYGGALGTGTGLADIATIGVMFLVERLQGIKRFTE